MIAEWWLKLRKHTKIKMTKSTKQLISIEPNKIGNIMTVTEFARLGGLSKSPAKKKASRENGKKGGRPKKEK